MNRKNKRNSLPTVEIKEDDEIVADEEIDKWKRKSYHKIDVIQNMGDGRHNENNQINDNAEDMAV